MPASSIRLWKRIRWWLYWGHRWSGIALCVLFGIWFVSGIVMMYVPFPSFRAEERVAAATPIAWENVRVGPQAALARLRLDAFPDKMRLGMAGGEPVYQVDTGGARRAVSARTGLEVGPVDARQAAAIAAAFTGVEAGKVDLIDHDQWVVTRAYARIAPFWRVRMEDGQGTDIYVTRANGEVVQNTNRRERFWNWLGAVPHWIYFEALRIHQEPWRQTVIWTSGIGIVSAVLGIWIGVLRLRVRRRYKSGSVSPYQGWMKWHHVTGLVGGVFLVTWVFSGWLSMSPFGGLGSGDADAIEARYTGAQATRFAPTDLAALAHKAAGAVELRFQFIGGRPVILALKSDGSVAALDGLSGHAAQPGRRTILALARQAVPGARMTGFLLLTEHDRYWYTTGDPRREARPVPALRIQFDDAAHSWLYIDPATGALLGQSSDGRRSYRWLFSALHSFDLPALLVVRPIRDGLMIILSLMGLLISVSGVVVGLRYLRRCKPRFGA